MRRAALLLLALSACAPRVLWYRTAPADATVYGDGDAQWMRIGNEHGPRFEGIATDAVVFSPDGRRFAYPAMRGGRWYMVDDGRELGPWDGIAAPRLSPDGKRLLFLAQTGAQWRVVTDGVEGALYDEVRASTLQFSRGGAHTGYVARTGTCVRAVIDAAEGPCFENVRALGVTSDGQAALIVRDNGAEHFIFRGERGPAEDAIGEWAMTDERFAYVHKRDGQWGVVSDGKVVAACDSARQLRFSQDGQSLVFVCGKGAHAAVVINGEAGRRYRIVSPLLVTRNVAYAAEDERGNWVVVGNMELGPYRRVFDLALSRDGTAVAFIVPSPDGRVIVHNGNETPVSAFVDGTLTLSEDGKHVGYISGDPVVRELFLYVDGERLRHVKGEFVFGQERQELQRWVARQVEGVAR